jgi:hypothetical protein
MGYVDKQIAAARKTLGDAAAGKGLQKAIRALQEKSKVYDSLKDLPARGAITAKRKTAKRTGGTDTGDFTEISRAFHTTLRELRSSDGLFVLEYYNVSRITTDRAVFNYLDYDPDA